MVTKTPASDKTQRDWLDLIDGLMAEAELKKWRQDPSTAQAWEQVKAELIAEGLLSLPDTEE